MFETPPELKRNVIAVLQRALNALKERFPGAMVDTNLLNELYREMLAQGIKEVLAPERVFSGVKLMPNGQIDVVWRYAPDKKKISQLIANAVIAANDSIRNEAVAH